MSYRNFDFEEEGRDDVIRQEIEATYVPDPEETAYWEALAASWDDADEEYQGYDS